MNWLSNLKNEFGYYSLEQAKEKFKVIELVTNESWLVLNGTPDEGYCWLKFAVVQFYSSSCDNADVEVSLVFHGEGPTGSLRECRHTWWGEKEDGYLFYPKAKTIVRAMEELSKIYEMD